MIISQQRTLYTDGPPCCHSDQRSSFGTCGEGGHGASLKAEPGSHPGDVGPGRERVQVKHGLTPAVDGQCDAKDANDVHDDSCTGHVSNPEVSVRKDDGIWRRSNGQHEGERSTQSTRHHDV